MCAGIFDPVFFNVATNAQNYGLILASRYPCISVGNGDEHVVSLFLMDVFSKIPAYESLMNFFNRIRNIFGSTRHATTAMFNKY